VVRLKPEDSEYADAVRICAEATALGYRPLEGEDEPPVPLFMAHDRIRTLGTKFSKDVPDGPEPWPENLNSPVLMHCYFDESGGHDDRGVLVVAGWTATPDTWSAFEVLWADVLARGEFSGWDSERRNALTRSVVELLTADSLPLGFAFGVDLSAHRRTFKKEHLESARSLIPYYLCARGASAGVAHPSHSGGFPIRVRFTFADQDNKRLEELISGYRRVAGRRCLGCRLSIGEVTVDSPRTCIPLQAADLLAYETRLFFSRLKEGEIKSRGSFARLGEKTKIEFLEDEQRRSIVENDPVLADFRSYLSPTTRRSGLRWR
jgi:hypothetical protein